jgi:hypothetical protein
VAVPIGLGLPLRPPPPLRLFPLAELLHGPPQVLLADPEDPGHGPDLLVAVTTICAAPCKSSSGSAVFSKLRSNCWSTCNSRAARRMYRSDLRKLISPRAIAGKDQCRASVALRIVMSALWKGGGWCS